MTGDTPYDWRHAWRKTPGCWGLWWFPCKLNLWPLRKKPKHDWSPFIVVYFCLVIKVHIFALWISERSRPIGERHLIIWWGLRFYFCWWYYTSLSSNSKSLSYCKRRIDTYSFVNLSHPYIPCFLFSWFLKGDCRHVSIQSGKPRCSVWGLYQMAFTWRLGEHWICNHWTISWPHHRRLER